MFDFLIGLAVGTAFAPFWIMLWNKYVKPEATAVVTQVEAAVTKTPPPAA